MTSRKRLARCLISCSVLLPFFGCGKSVPAVQLAPVSGQVKMDGKPLANATVVFHPESGNAASVDSSGTTEEHGNYHLKTFDGRVKGRSSANAKVTINLIDRERTGGKLGITAVPKQYNTESTLSCTVPAGGH